MSNRQRNFSGYTNGLAGIELAFRAFVGVAICASALVLSGCGEKGCTDPAACNYSESAKRDDGSCEFESCDFSQSAMLEDIATNNIMLGYQTLVTDMNSMSAGVLAFRTEPTVAQLNTVQTQLKTAWLTWQRASAFEFGPAADLTLRSQLNTYPTDTAQIGSNVAQGGYNLGTADNIDAKGFPALDYLLNGLASDDTGIVAAYNGADSTAWRTYLTEVVEDINSKVTAVHQSWGDSYKETFVNNTGTDAGSSVGLLVNQLNFDYELIKNPQVGIPLGKKSLNVALPEKCEAVYGGYSMELANAHLDAIEDLYRGRDISGTDRTGLDDYLSTLGSTYGNGLLHEEIDRQFAETQQALAQVPDPYSDTVVNNTPPADAAYEQIQLLLVLLKTDMPSALGVLITYQDNDGD